MRGLLRINGMALLLATVILPATAAQPGPSTPMVVTWTTWMRAAPSDHARAIDELGTGTPVQIDTCQAGWCRVRDNRVDGYVHQRDLAAALTPLQPGQGPCFPAQYYTAEGPLPLTICPAKQNP